MFRQCKADVSGQGNWKDAFLLTWSIPDVPKSALIELPPTKEDEAGKAMPIPWSQIQLNYKMQDLEGDPRPYDPIIQRQIDAQIAQARAQRQVQVDPRLINPRGGPPLKLGV